MMIHLAYKKIMAGETSNPWLVLIHQIPPEPGYLRVKIGRRLQRIGSVPLKNSVYVLPTGEQAEEDYQWIAGEIRAGGGEAMVCQVRFVDGLDDDQVKALFHAARNQDYGEIAAEAKQAGDAFGAGPADEDAQRAQARRSLVRLKRRLTDVVALDFFGAPGLGEAETALLDLEGRLQALEPGGAEPAAGARPGDEFRGRTWVTRAAVRIDRMASAWLIRRFIDPSAEFKFVVGQDYRPTAGELRFDMFQAEFTHEGENCTFEVLLARMGLRDSALGTIGEIVHDIDLKDWKFQRPEAAGIAPLISGIALRCNEDEERLARSAVLFDDLYEHFRRESGE